MNKHKVLVASPVCQKPEILEVFLGSLKQLNCGAMSMDYIFVDDNTDVKSSQLLNVFEREQSKVTVLPGKGLSSYQCDEKSHYWSDDLMLRVAHYKNEMIQCAIDQNYDAIFFADSDLILHPDLILHLKSQKKEIVSEIFWSQWHPELELEPNVWLFDEYDLIPRQLGEELTQSEMDKRKNDFLKMLREPGLYEVGGLGACTLISKSALLKGVSFAPIKNLTIHGEDRFFCIRAAVLGIELFVDTFCPVYHIYRESDLAGVSNYIRDCKFKHLTNRITLSMVVKNEEGRYLRDMLKGLVNQIDEAVIIDDGSTDNTALICEEILGDIPMRLIKNQNSMFDNEVKLRKLQWEETIRTNPDWILNLDADEFVESTFWKGLKEKLRSFQGERFCFRLFDMWSDTEFREDKHWNAHETSRTFFIRYRPDFAYQWKETPQHCGRFPFNLESFLKADKEYRIRHFGWATEEDRRKKYKRYQLLDPGAVYGIREQYESILDENPRLVEWSEHE